MPPKKRKREVAEDDEEGRPRVEERRSLEYWQAMDRGMQGIPSIPQKESKENPDPTVENYHDPGFKIDKKSQEAQQKDQISTQGSYDEQGNYHFELEDSNLYLGCGQVRSGKSFLLRALLLEAWYKFIIKFGIVFSCTPWNGFWQTILPEKAVKEFSIDRLEDYLEWLSVNKEQYGKSFLIIEDAVGSLRTGAIIEKLVANYRHYDISFLGFATQYIYKMPPIVREQACLVGIFKHYTKKSLMALYETFGSSFYSYKEFINYLKMATEEKHSCLLYRMTADVDNISEKYVSFKAPDFDPNDKRNKLTF